MAANILVEATPELGVADSQEHIKRGGFSGDALEIIAHGLVSVASALLLVLTGGISKGHVGTKNALQRATIARQVPDCIVLLT